MLPRVIVKEGLSFSCPRCGKFGYRAANSSDIFTAPVGHRVGTLGIPPHKKVFITCFWRNADWTFRLIFDDVPLSNQAR